MGARTDNRKWLGDDADTPAGNAWDAVLRADYARLEATLERYGEQPTLTAQGPIGHPVTALAAAARQGDTKALSMPLDAGGSATTPTRPPAWPGTRCCEPTTSA